MNNRALVLAATALAATVSVPAHSATFLFNFSGAGVNGSVALTYVVNPNTGVLPGTSPNPVDPIGSYIVTDASGIINDTNIGFSANITGTVPSNPADPTPTNLLAPASFGHFLVANGVPGPDGVAPGFSYDNLFYPGGSPPAATDYPFGGGFLDIYGLVFTTASGNWVNFWSNSDTPFAPLNYGLGVTDGTDVLDYVGGIQVQSVPEPATWAMLIAGFAVVGAALRRRRVRVEYSFA